MACEPIMAEVEMARPRNRLAGERPGGEIEIGLVGPVVAQVGRILDAVIVDAHHQHDDRRREALPQALQHQIFLIGAVGVHAEIDEAIVRHHAAQQIGEALAFLRVVAPHKQVRRRTQLSACVFARARYRGTRCCCGAPEPCASRCRSAPNLGWETNRALHHARKPAARRSHRGGR